MWCSSTVAAQSAAAAVGADNMRHAVYVESGERGAPARRQRQRGRTNCPRT